MTLNSAPDKMVPTTAAKVAFLSSAKAYTGVDIVEVRETRMAWVFLAGERVYKFKKPIQHQHLDFTTLAERHRICREEVRLNRRLAADVYLGLAKLTIETNGTLAINGSGRVVEWLVEMQRLPESLFLDNAIRAGTVDRSEIIKVADRLAQFFKSAPPVNVEPDRHIATFTFELARNRNVFLEWRFNSVSARGLDIVSQLEGLLNDTPEIVLDRLTAGHIVEGHGDLRPEHVHLSDPPIVIDCLEFRSGLRMLDPFEELSYLSMECAVLGAPWIRPIIIDRCSAKLGTPPTSGQLAFYTAYRATLRARQALAHLLVPNPRTPEKWIPLAKAYLDEAEKAMITFFPPAIPPTTHSDEGRL